MHAPPLVDASTAVARRSLRQQKELFIYHRSRRDAEQVAMTRIAS
jgi:hypothetical protein